MIFHGFLMSIISQCAIVKCYSYRCIMNVGEVMDI